MTAKEFRRLRRSDLLEMMLELRRENEQLRQQLEAAQRQLESRKIDIENAGSLAEAALQLNSIFESAQTACELYTENVRLRIEQQERDAAEKYDAILMQAQEQTRFYNHLDENRSAPRKQGGWQ